MLDYSKRIVCAANYNAYTNTIICGARHYDSVMRRTYQVLDTFCKDSIQNIDEQGFINTWGQFLNRRDAWLVACANNQILRLVGSQTESDIGKYGTKLYSENLY